MHEQIRHVCTFAVEVNADDSKFPDDWLFKYRWVSILPVISCVPGRAFDVSVWQKGKGKKVKGDDKPTLKLVSALSAD